MVTIFSILFVSFPIFSQGEEKTCAVTLSYNECSKYLKVLKTSWLKIQDLPEGTFWTDGDCFFQTNGKIVDNQKYQMYADREFYLNGKVMSLMEFSVRSNDAGTRYYPIEILAFSYDHKAKIGTLFWITQKFFDDPSLYPRSPGEIKQEMNKMISEINKFI